jgi:4-hydroxy-tetrahydrodipicolinate synthase
LLPWVQACFAEPNPAPLKALLAQAGWLRNELRPPMTPASQALAARVAMLGGFSPAGA